MAKRQTKEKAHPVYRDSPKPTEECLEWIEKIRECETKEDVFAVVKEFRLGEWSDIDRSFISKTYVPIVNQMMAREQWRRRRG